MASLSMGILQQEYWSGLLCPLPGNLPNRGIKSRSPTLLADSLPSEPPGKPKNTGVGSLSLLQGIFQTQELNWGILHYRWILYKLNYLTDYLPAESIHFWQKSVKISNWLPLFSLHSYQFLLHVLWLLCLFGVVVQSLSHVSLWPQGLQHARIPCPSLSPGVRSDSCPLSRWFHPTISFSVTPFSSYPPEQDPVFLMAAPSHQEACTSFLPSSIRRQREEARTTIPWPPEWKPQSQKTNHEK